MTSDENFRRHSLMGEAWFLVYRTKMNILMHYGVKGQKWGIRKDKKHVAILNNTKKQMNISSVVISRNKFINYALNEEKAPDKAKAFKSALGYTKYNCDKLIQDIENHIDTSKMVEKGHNGYGMRYEQILNLAGPNGKKANVMTAWIQDEANCLRLTSVYITKKGEKNENTTV